MPPLNHLLKIAYVLEKFGNLRSSMIKDKITPELKSTFLTAINKTKETGKEHGFFLCTDGNGNISPSKLQSGELHRINLGSPSVACHGQTVKGDFHVHNYFTLTKNTSKFVKLGMPDKDIKKLIRNKFGEYKKDTGIKELTIDSPSPKDLLHSIAHKCADIGRETVCVSSDMGNNRIECWTPRDITNDVCAKTFNALYEDGTERKIVGYSKWMIPLFDKKVINLG